MRLRELLGALAGVAIVLAGLAAPTAAFALDPSRSIQDMYHRTYGQADGLPSGLTTITQSPDGYLWVGSTRGLYRFDGVRFEPVAASDLLGPSIIGLCATRGGDIWIGYDMGGGVSRLRNGRIEHFRSENGGPSGSVNNIRVSDDGAEVFTHGAYTVWRFFDGRWTEILKGKSISQIELARGGVLWAKNRDQLFYCRPRGGECHAAPGYGGGVTGLTRDREGRVWTTDTTAGGRMYRAPDVIGVADSAIPGPEYGATAPQRMGNRIYVDRDGSMWGLNAGKGVLRMRSVFADRGAPGDIDTFTEEDGLTSNIVSRFFEDREGGLWVSTKAGLDYFRPANVVIERALPRDVGVAGYFGQTVGDDLYVQANVTDRNSGPLFKMSPDGQIEKLLDDVGALHSLARTDDGAIWLNAGGIPYRLWQGKAALLAPPSEREFGGKVTHVSGFVGAPDNKLWMLFWMNGMWEVTDGVWSRHPTMPTAEQLRRVELVRPGRDGAVWLSHYDPYKLFRYDNGRFQSFTDAEVKIGSISNVTVSGRFEYLSGEHGVAVFDGERFHALRSDRVPALVSVRDAAVFGKDLWAVSQAGILRFDREDAERAMRDLAAPAPRYDLFDQLDGLPAAFVLSSQSPAEDVVFQRPDGQMIILTGAGVVSIDPKRMYRNALAPPVVIRKLIVNGRVYDAPRHVDLPAGSQNLEIDYAALSFIEQRRVRFRYKLEGVDRDWVDPGDRREALYTRLGPGDYIFRVLAANDAGVWNEEGATLTFSVAPTFLQSIWFKLIVVVALLVLAVTAYVARLRWETARIRRQFEIRIGERERIARELHDTLLQGVQGLVLRVQSVTNTLPAESETRESLEQTLDRADVVLREGRDRVRDLRLPQGGVGLRQMVMESARRLIPEGPPAFHLTVEGGPRVLFPEVQEEVSRIAEEAIRNATAHANATAIEVIISFDISNFRLVVRDDGAGIDLDVARSGKREGHFGLIGMTERAARIGGRLAVNSRERSGTEILLSVPARKVYSDGLAGILGSLRVRRMRAPG